MGMAYSYNEVTATGSAQLIAVPEYVDQAHIKVSINGVDTTSFTWTNASTVSVTATAGAKVRVRRETSPGARVVDYLDGMSLTEAVLDADSKQAFYLAQEQLDATNEAVGAYGSLAATLITIQNETDESAANAAAAAASASSASTSAGTATTKAGEAAASAGTATTKAGEAAASALAASTSESNAASSAGTATTKAGEALTSANNAAVSAANAAASATGIQNSTDKWITSVAGTNTITGVLSPALTSYVAGQVFNFVAAGANTGATTIAINGLAAKAIVKNGSTALSGGELVAGQAYSLTYDGTNFQLAGGTGGGGTSGAVNSQTLTNGLVVSAGFNQSMVGPLTVPSGKSISVATGSRLVIL